MFTLVLGGRRSGKSLWAENQALGLANSLHSGSGKMLYLATAPSPLPGDVEMQKRISEHQKRRESQLSLAWQENSDRLSQNLTEEHSAHRLGHDLSLQPGGSKPAGFSSLHSARNKPRQWVTIEEPLNLVSCLQKQANCGFDLIFIDCITLWLCNLMQQNRVDEEILQDVEKLAELLADFPLPVFAISNEVGMGVAPATQVGNRFCDLAGRANQMLAKKAKRVVFVIAGLPLFLK